MYFNKTSTNFYKKGNNKLPIENIPLITDKTRNNQDLMQYYYMSSQKYSAINSVESKNIHNSFRNDIRSYREKRKTEIDNFHKKNLNECFSRNFEVNTKNSGNQISIQRKENKSYDYYKNLYTNHNNSKDYNDSSRSRNNNNNFRFYNYENNINNVQQDNYDSNSFSKEQVYKFHLQNKENSTKNIFTIKDDESNIDNSMKNLKIKTNYNTIDNNSTQEYDKTNQMSLLYVNNNSKTIDYLETKASNINNQPQKLKTKLSFYNINNNHYNNIKTELERVNTISTSQQINNENFNNIKKIKEGKFSTINTNNNNIHVNSIQELNQTHNEILINKKIFRDKISCSRNTNNIIANTPTYTAATTVSKPYNQTYYLTRDKSNFNNNRDNIVSNVKNKNPNSPIKTESSDYSDEFHKYLNKELNEKIFDKASKQCIVSKTRNLINNFKMSTDHSNINDLSITGSHHKRKDSEYSNRGYNNTNNFNNERNSNEGNLNLNENLKIKDYYELDDNKNRNNKVSFDNPGGELITNLNNQNISKDNRSLERKDIGTNLKNNDRMYDLDNTNEEGIDSSNSNLDAQNDKYKQIEENPFLLASKKKESKKLNIDYKDCSLKIKLMDLTENKSTIEAINLTGKDEISKLSKTPRNKNIMELDIFKEENETKNFSKFKTLNSNHSKEQEAEKIIMELTKTEPSNELQYNRDEAEKIKNSIYYEQSNLIKSYNKQYNNNNFNNYNNTNTQSVSSISNKFDNTTNFFLNTDKNFFFKSNLGYPNLGGKEGIGSFVEKTKFLMKQNYLKSIQEERVLRIKEEFSNQKEEMELKVRDIQEYKRFFIEDFLGTLEKYSRFCLRQKEREAQELARLIDEKNNTNQEIIKLEKRKEKLFQEFTVFSEYKLFLLCVRYRIKSSIFLEFFLKQGGSLKIKDEIKNAIIIDNLRKKNIGRINNLKKNNNHTQGRRKTIFCNWTRVAQNPQGAGSNSNAGKSDDISEKATAQNSLNTSKNYSRNNTSNNLIGNNNANTLSVDSNKSNFIYNSTNNIGKENYSKALANTNKNMVLFKNLQIEGTSVKSIPIFEENKNLSQSSSRDNLRVNSKRNSSERLRGFSNIQNDTGAANQLGFPSVVPKSKNSKNSIVPIRENSNSDIIASFIPPNKKSSNLTNYQSKSKSEKNIVNISFKDKNRIGNEESDFSKKLSDFSALLKSLKDLDNKEEQMFKRNLHQSVNNKTGIFSVSSSTITNSFPNFKTILNFNNTFNNNNKSDENRFLRHYDKSLEFINGISHQNEEVRNLIISKNSKGFNLVNKFFNPFNKTEIEKQVLLGRMYELYNTKNVIIFESVEEFDEVFHEMQQRNLDLINIYNKNEIILLEIANKKRRIDMNNHIDEGTSETINKMEKHLKSQKQQNLELKAILKAAEEKYNNLRISETVFGKMTEIFERLRFLGVKVNDNFHIYEDLHPNINIFESLQMFRIIEKCMEFLSNRLKIYKKDEKYKNELTKILREIENVKKRKILQLEKEQNQANKLKMVEKFYDKCVRSDIYSQKRKIGDKYNFFAEDKKKSEVIEDQGEQIHNEFYDSSEDSGYE